VGDDSDIASGEHRPGTLNPGCDRVHVPGGVLLDGSVNDLRLGDSGTEALRHSGSRRSRD